MSGLYVYGIMPAGQPAPDLPGIGGAAVTAAPCRDLAALVSTTAAGPVDRTRRNMLTHTAVLEGALRLGTVLPLRFGTIAPGQSALQACVLANRAAFQAALGSVHGRVELGLKASWRRGVVYNEIVEADPALRHLRDRLRTRPATETYYERIELGRRVETALAQLRAAEASALTAQLLELAERHVELRPADDDMIFNHAFLVSRAREPAFDAAVGALAERQGERLELRYVGPVPPFNFVALQASWFTAAAQQEPV